MKHQASPIVTRLRRSFCSSSHGEGCANAKKPWLRFSALSLFCNILLSAFTDLKGEYSIWLGYTEKSHHIFLTAPNLGGLGRRRHPVFSSILGDTGTLILLWCCYTSSGTHEKFSEDLIWVNPQNNSCLVRRHIPGYVGHAHHRRPFKLVGGSSYDPTKLLKIHSLPLRL